MRIDAHRTFPPFGCLESDWAVEAAGPVCHLASATASLRRAWNEEEQARQSLPLPSPNPMEA